MHNRIIYTALMMIASFYAYALDGSEDNITAKANVGEIFPHFNQSATSNGSSQTNYRLIARTNRKFDGGGFLINDSVQYNFFTNHGGVPDLEDPQKDTHILFDESVSFTYNHFTNSYTNEQRRTQEFYPDDKIDKLTYQSWHTQNGAWKNKERYIYYYDSLGKMTTTQLKLWYGGFWSNQDNSSLSYDGNNNVTQMSSTTYNVNFTYSSGKLISMEDKVWSTSNGWQPNERKNYHYVGSDVSTYILETYDVNSGTWNNSKKWDYTYNLNNEVEKLTEYFWDGTWRVKNETRYVYNSNGDVETKTLLEWSNTQNTFVNKQKEAWIYNSHNLLSELISYTWNGSSFIHSDGDTYTKYYYQFYHPTSISSFALDDNAIQLYPNPANNIVHLNVKDVESKSIDISIVNMIGKVVYQQHQVGKKVSDTEISTAGLPTGNYLFKLTSGSQTIAKQLVVTH